MQVISKSKIVKLSLAIISLTCRFEITTASRNTKFFFRGEEDFERLLAVLIYSTSDRFRVLAIIESIRLTFVNDA